MTDTPTRNQGPHRKWRRAPAHGSGAGPSGPPSGRAAAASRTRRGRLATGEGPTRPSEWARRAPSRPLESPPVGPSRPCVGPSRLLETAESAQQSPHSAPNHPDWATHVRRANSPTRERPRPRFEGRLGRGRGRCRSELLSAVVFSRVAGAWPMVARVCYSSVYF